MHVRPRQLRHIRPLYTVLAFLPVLGWLACSRAPVETHSPSALPSRVVVDGASQADLAKDGFTGVRIEIGPDVKYVSESVTSTPGSTKRSTTLNGQPFEIVGNELHIGTRKYGPLSLEDSVVVDAKGVHVNGKLAGELP